MIHIVNNRPKGGSLDLFSMLRIAHASEDDVESKLNPIGLSLTKLMALKVLEEAGDPVPLGQFAERLSCVKSNITQLVDRLEADGLVARKPDPRDRRTTLAALTTAGRRAYREGTRMQRETERGLSRRLTRDEARHLGALLAKVARPQSIE
jgi:DNA-binding MarR family transcriptional regulator